MQKCQIQIHDQEVDDLMSQRHQITEQDVTPSVEVVISGSTWTWFRVHLGSLFSVGWPRRLHREPCRMATKNLHATDRLASQERVAHIGRLGRSGRCWE